MTYPTVHLSSSPPQPARDLSKSPKRLSASRLPVLRKVSGTVASAPSSPITITRPSAQAPRGPPTIAKRSSSTRLASNGVRNGSTQGSTVHQSTAASIAKITPRRSTSNLNASVAPILKPRLSSTALRSINTPSSPVEPPLAKKPSQSQLPASRPSITPKGRRTSDISGVVAPPLNRRASNTALRQPPATVARRSSNNQLARKSSLVQLDNVQSEAMSPTPLRRATLKSELPPTPKTPTIAKQPLRVSARTPKPQPLPAPSESLSPKKTPGSHRIASQSLRDTIAKARAAAKTQSGPPAAGSLDGFNFNADDPFNQAVFGEGGSSKALMQRVKQARFEGRLNICALQLKEIPKEVYKMYETTEEGLQKDDENGPKWYESVDLVKFLAADNEFEEFGDELVQQFPGLATIDMHNNLLSKLPQNFGMLTELTSLNLSNNKLTNEALETIFQITSLKDLKLTRNSLEGELDASISALNALEVLELKENKLTSLPSSLGQLPRLRVLEVGKNALESLPMEDLAKCSLQELDVSHNKLSGELFPSSIQRWDSLHSFNCSSNRITAISSSGIVLPVLTQLFASNNSIKALPPLSGWDALLILIVDQNAVSTLPDELFSLPRLRTLDFSGNDFKSFDNRLGLMDSLEAIKFDGNPLRDRALAGLSSADLKKTLRGRLAPPEIVVVESSEDEGHANGINGEVNGDEDETSSVGTPNGPSGAPEVGRGGVLDLSRRDLTTLSADLVESVIGTPTTVILTHNSLTVIPLQIEAFSSLFTLNLSNNRLSSDRYLTASIRLPSLESLNLHSTSIATLQPLYTYLDAPKLATLDVSANKLDSIEGLRQNFPTLLNFAASDNRVKEIPVESIEGLRMLDLTGNAVEALPPALALCEGLRELRVQGNLFRVPRWQVLEKGTDSVMAWLRDRLPADQQ